MGQYSDAVMNVFKELALDEMDHVQGIQTYLGACFSTCIKLQRVPLYLYQQPGVQSICAWRAAVVQQMLQVQPLV